MTLKTNNVQLGTNIVPDKNIVLSSDSSTGDFVISKGNHDGVLTEINRISTAGGGQVYLPAGAGGSVAGLFVVSLPLVTKFISLL